MSTDTGKVKLPALPSISSGNAAMDRWMQAVSERLEVREGNRGNQYERVVTLRDLSALGLDLGSLSVSAHATSKGVSIGGVMVQTPSGSFTRIPLDAFSEELRKTRLYRDLSQAINDAGRFDTLPEQLRNLLLDNIADEAAKRGADIQRLDKKVQTATESLAYTVQEVTAAVQGAKAGVREATFAAATANSATAGKVTQIQARLDDVGGVTIEESMIATADRVAGLAGEFMVKIGAGGTVAAIGLAASEDPDGNTESAFIIQAADFGVVAPYNYVQSTTPSAPTLNQTWYNTVALPDVNHHVSKRWDGESWVVFTPVAPFGVDTTTNTIYMNSALKVGNGGDALSLLATNAAVAPITFIGSFASAPATTSLKKNNVYKNTTDGNSYILSVDAGTWGVYLSKGEDGYTPVKGTDYVDGSDGTSVDVQYSSDNSNWHDTPGTGDLYIRTGTKASGASSFTYGDGVKFVPEFGVEYHNGTDGVSHYLHIKYSDNGTTFTASSGETPGAYLGTYSDASVSDSSTFSDYTWVKIRGENGTNGTNGTSGADGNDGIRGTITTNISGAWGSSSPAAASAQITTVANATGATPNYPIRGDIVYYTGGAKVYSGSAWGDATFTLDGSMLATGTIGAQVALDTEGYVKAVGASGAYSIQITAGSGGAVTASTAGSFNYGGSGHIGVMGFSSAAVGAGVYGQGSNTETSSFGTFGYGFYGAMGRSGGVASVAGETVYGVGVIGQAVGSNTNGIGVQGDSNSGANSKAVYGNAFAGGWAVYGYGPMAATGNITANYSDDRLKTRLGKIRNALDKVDSLDTFYYKPNKVAKKLGYKTSREVGVSAQQVQAIMPEVVAPAPIDDKYLTVRYERLLPLVLAAIKELRAEVNKLKVAQ